MQSTEAQAEQAFAGIWKTTIEGKAIAVRYESDRPKHEFLQYLVDRHDVVLHGTNEAQLATLHPSRAGGVPAEQALTAVYATDSAPETIFFAILDRAQVGSFSSSTYGQEYAVDKFADQAPWRPGTVYILPRASFERVSGYWVSNEAVAPLSSLAVAPPDFPYLEIVRQNRLPWWMKWVFRAVVWWKSRRGRL
jgi:hypothetical protein